MPKNPMVAPARRRQWGAESRVEPLPTVHPAPSDRTIALARLAIVATVVFWLTYVIYTILRQFINNGTESFRFTAEAVSYLIVVTFLTFSALMYLIARHGAYQRFRAHARVPRAELGRHFADVLAEGFDGHVASSAKTITTEEPADPSDFVDDPATSPYPIWKEDASYLAGTKIVWHRSVYQAKWWTQGDSPAAFSSDPDGSPWVPLTSDDIKAIADTTTSDESTTLAPASTEH